MSWFADLAGKAENLLNNLDEQTGAVLRNHDVTKKKDNDLQVQPEHTAWLPTQKKSPSRQTKKTNTENKTLHTVKPPPTDNHRSRSPPVETSERKPTKAKKSPTRKFNLHLSPSNCPKTLVSDIKDKEEQELLEAQKRCDLASNYDVMDVSAEWTFKMQNLEIENAMLKSELSTMNREVMDLMEKLHKTEDGNSVDSQDVLRTQIKLETSELVKHRVMLEKEGMNTQIEQLKQKVQEHITTEVTMYKEKNRCLQDELAVVKDNYRDLEDKCKKQEEKLTEMVASKTKLENELRHSQSNISELQSNLEKSTEECRRLEKEWEAYKVRVTSRLRTKDDEIKKLQEGVELTTDTKELMAEIESLKAERDELQTTMESVKSEGEQIKLCLQQVESRHSAAERIVVTLRDAMLNERAARNKLEDDFATVVKSLKTLQVETDQTIASLRSALRDNDEELSRLRANSCSTETNALNVADYDVIDNNKIEYLTQTLMSRQMRIDKLMAENNMLRIQMEKLESKLKTEMAAQTYSHSVVHLQDSECRHRSRPHATVDALSALSVRMGVMVKRYPVMRIFIVIYMICLHFWVLTVLLTSSPDDVLVMPAKARN